MRILITGAKGFMGKNLAARLRQAGYTALYEADVDTPDARLDAYCRDCEFVFHLAGVNRPKEQKEVMEGNCGALTSLLARLRAADNRCPVLLSSSIQAALDNPYGESKRAGEAALRAYGEETGAPTYIYRFPNVFGKWCRPNYNSVVATFCHNIANGLPIEIRDPAAMLRLIYIDDLIDSVLPALSGAVETDAEGFCALSVTHTVTLGALAALLYSFRDSREKLSVPDQTDPLTRKLYATYLSYLPEDGFSYPLTMHEDARGSFTEFLRLGGAGQVSVNIAHPGITKGNHWHHTKNEKFLVVSGSGVIRFRKAGEARVIEYPVSGERLTVVDIPTGYTHNIENTGETDMVTIMWANECFDREKPDTVYLEV